MNKILINQNYVKINFTVKLAENFRKFGNIKLTWGLFQSTYRVVTTSRLKTSKRSQNTVNVLYKTTVKCTRYALGNCTI